MNGDPAGSSQLDLSAEDLMNRKCSSRMIFDDLISPYCSDSLASSDVLETFLDVTELDISAIEGNSQNKQNNVQFPSRRLNNTEINILSGALAGFISGIIVCPFDVAKTRLQAQVLCESPKYYNRLFGTFKSIIKDEGLRGLYNGIVPIVIGYLPAWMIYFSVYEKCKEVYPPLLKKDFLLNSASALTAGVISATLSNPIWVVKTRLMVQSSKKRSSTNYKGTIDAFRKIYKNEGLKVFYSGLLPSLFGLIHVAIQFPVYEKLKVLLHRRHSTPGNIKKLDNNDLKLNKLIIASCISKILASTITYPHEILRTRMQIRTTNARYGAVALMKKIYINEGFVGFYLGFTANIIKTVPASTLTLVSFEYFTRYFRLWNNKLID